MAGVIILALVKAIVAKIGHFVEDLAVTKIKEVISAKEDFKIIAEKLDAICAVLADAEERQYSGNAIKIWLRDLKSVVYDIDDLLDDLTIDVLQRRVNEGYIASITRHFWYYFSLSNDNLISSKIHDLRVKLENIVAKKNDFNLTERPVEISSDEVRDPLDRCANVNEATVVGREPAKQHILRRITLASDASSELSVLSVVGMGGIGKTTLAKLVYKDVLDFDLKLWACVSDNFQLEKILEDIVKHGASEKSVSIQNLDTLIKKLHDLLDGRKYFLVLDDVWEEDIAKWLELKNLLTVGKAGSMILITTRSDRVGLIIGTVKPYKLDNLPVEVCWSIFKKFAFVEGEEQKFKDLVKIGRLIVEKCDGIPLVVKTLGVMLKFERDEQQWQKIKDMDSFAGLNGQYDKVISLLKLSYNKLPSHLKPCFAYLSLLAKDETLYTSQVIN